MKRSLARRRPPMAPVPVSLSAGSSAALPPAALPTSILAAALTSVVLGMRSNPDFFAVNGDASKDLHIDP